MASYPILPSLSRAPSFASTREVKDDGVLSDPMESGYVTTRPRFTRIRQTFGVTYKYLTAEDLRVLDKFERLTVQGKAGGFYLPNLLPNGSFEVAAQAGSGQFVDGWTRNDFAYYGPETAPPTYTVALTSTADDGLVAVQFTNAAYSGAANAYDECQLVASSSFPVSVGDVLQFSSRVSAVNTVSSANYCDAFLAARVVVKYSDGSSVNLGDTLNMGTGAAGLACTGKLLARASTSGFTDSPAATFTIPASATAGVSPVSASLLLFAFIGHVSYVSGAAWYSTATATAGQAVFSVDSVGLALTSAAHPYGRMPGSAPLPGAVRFAKSPSIRDLGWGDGQKRYEATFEVQEI